MAHNPDIKKLRDSEYRERNRLVLRERQRLTRLALRLETFKVYGECCVRCGYNDLRALQIDHVENNGAEERKSLGGQNFSGWRFYKWLKTNGWPEGYQTLCANCNLVKHIESRVPSSIG